MRIVWTSTCSHWWLWFFKYCFRFPKSKGLFCVTGSGDLSGSLSRPQISGNWPLERQNRSIFGRLSSLLFEWSEIMAGTVFSVLRKKYAKGNSEYEFPDNWFLKRAGNSNDAEILSVWLCISFNARKLCINRIHSRPRALEHCSPSLLRRSGERNISGPAYLFIRLIYS